MVSSLGRPGHPGLEFFGPFCRLLMDSYGFGRSLHLWYIYIYTHNYIYIYLIIYIYNLMYIYIHIEPVPRVVKSFTSPQTPIGTSSQCWWIRYILRSLSILGWFVPEVLCYDWFLLYFDVLWCNLYLQSLWTLKTHRHYNKVKYDVQ